MAATENLNRVSSRSHLSKSSSASPSISQSVREQNKKTKSSKSSQSVSKNGSFVSARNASLQSQERVSKADKDKSKGDRCERGPDLYSRVLGHTADETILTGLQTVIDLCNKLRVCGDRDESGDEEPEREQDVPERDTPSVISTGFQIKPSMTTVASQTFPSNLVSNVMQTSYVEIAEPKPTMNTLFIQTSNTTLTSDAIQTIDPGLKYELVQTSSALLPIIKCPAMTSCPTQVNTLTFCEGTETPGEHCIAPPEPPQKRKTCRCCKCSASTIIKKKKTENGKRPCHCTNKKLSKCRCGKQDYEVAESKEPEEVRYAVTKISKYKEYTTFEVMRSTKHKPRQIPKGVEGVFVLKKKNENSKNDLKSRSKSKSEINGLNGLRNEDEASRRQSFVSEYSRGETE